MTKQQRGYLFIFLLIMLLGVLVWYFRPNSQEVNIEKVIRRDDEGRLLVVASSFPVFDFARIVGGDQASVSLILPPGVESHSYLPDDVAVEKINTAAIFFYTSDLMEPWVKEMGLKADSLVASAADLGDGVDPHVWLDFTLAEKMIDKISQTYQELDPNNAHLYQARVSSYKEQLKTLDQNFSQGLGACQWREFISGGHDTFTYLAKRYNLNYQAVQGVTPDDSVDVDRIMTLSADLKKSGQPYVYFEELIMPYLAELIHQGSGARLMALNAAHNVGRFDVESGVNFLNIMETNLNALRLGLNCQ